MYGYTGKANYQDYFFDLTFNGKYSKQTKATLLIQCLGLLGENIWYSPTRGYLVGIKEVYQRHIELLTICMGQLHVVSSCT